MSPRLPSPVSRSIRAAPQATVPSAAAIASPSLTIASFPMSGRGRDSAWRRLRRPVVAAGAPKQPRQPLARCVAGEMGELPGRNVDRSAGTPHQEAPETPQTEHRAFDPVHPAPPRTQIGRSNSSRLGRIGAPLTQVRRSRVWKPPICPGGRRSPSSTGKMARAYVQSASGFRGAGRLSFRWPSLLAARASGPGIRLAAHPGSEWITGMIAMPGPCAGRDEVRRRARCAASRGTDPLAAPRSGLPSPSGGDHQPAATVWPRTPFGAARAPSRYRRRRALGEPWDDPQRSADDPFRPPVAMAR